jgi:hypothetical protein
MPDIRERPPLNAKTSTAGPLGGNGGDQGAPTTQRKTLMVGPWEAVLEIQELPPLNEKTSTTGPLGGSARDLGAPTTQRKIVDGGPPGKRC